MKDNTSYEEAIIELEKTVQSLESGKLSLDESMEFFKKGMDLVSFCQKKLDESEKKITMLIQKKDGSYTENDFQA